jgi:drug/metabolite transporter (DMT)-like permease
LRNVALLVLAAACWGLGTVVSKQAVAEIPALSLLAVQLAVSVGALAIVLVLRGERPPTDRAGRILGRLGLLNPGIAYALSLVGLTTISASLAVLLWAGEPVLIVLLAALVLHERLGRGIVIASAAAIAGLVLVIAEPSTGGSAVGIGLTVAGVVACAAYTVLTRRFLLGSDSTFGVVFAQQVHALALAIGVVGIATVLGSPALPERLTLAGALSAIVSGLLYYALAYSFYISALRAVPASVAAMSFYLIPVFGLAGGLATGERLEPIQWAGAVIVVLAVATVTILAGRPVSEPIRADGLARSPN